ncbi:hypothetical protein AABB24_020129 [Solanum stoloniferum]|uniref:Uncharacterized protein n=1 Tax=Solanum stoloniferum TaxID=62892 RepID=A0ABD2T7P2_9SOLN
MVYRLQKYEDTSLMRRHKSIAIVQGKTQKYGPQPRSIYNDIRKGMNSMFEPLRTRMVTILDPYLQVWWKFINKEDKKKVQRHIGHLPSLMEMMAYPDLIGTMVKF